MQKLCQLLAEIPLRSCPENGVLSWLAQERDAIIRRGSMAGRRGEGISLPQIARFLESPLGRRLISAARIERELEFSHPVAARALLGEETDEPVVLQGVIDCCFLERGRWVLIDYKTDFVPPGGAPEIAQRHRAQLALYAVALAAVSGILVGERYVVLLRAGENVRVDLPEQPE